MAYTRKPCPGCGQVDHGRAADHVCRTCRTKLDKIAAIEAEAVVLRAKVTATLAIETKPHAVWLSDRGYGIAAGRLADAPEYHDFAAATATMIVALTKPLDRGQVEPYSIGHNALPQRCEYHLTPTHHEVRGWAETTEEGADATRHWWRSFATFAQALYGAGVMDGQDLLGQLAAGTMTVDQVNDKAYELATRRRR